MYRVAARKNLPFVFLCEICVEKVKDSERVGRDRESCFILLDRGGNALSSEPKLRDRDREITEI